MNRFESAFRSLKYRNFRLFFPGLIISQIGIWLQTIALSWLVYSLTNSPLLMGIVMFFNSIPLFIVSPFAGVLIDKFSKQKLLMIVQTLFAIQAFLIAMITILGFERIWNLILLGIFFNTVVAIDIPLRQSIFVDLVDDKKDLGNAISLNSTGFNIARLLGPAIAGILISKVGEGTCFLINFICFLPSLFLVSMMKVNEIKDERVRNNSIFNGLKEGIKYLRTNERLVALLLFLGIFSFLGMTYPMLMPIYTKDIFHANADILGYFMASAGTGALLSSILIASKRTINGLKYVLLSGAVLFSLTFILLGFSKNINTSMVIMFFLGLAMTSIITSVNTLVQSVIPDEVRGRVMSIHAICFIGTNSISNFFLGVSAEHIGILNTFILLGLLMILSAIYFCKRLRHFKFSL